MLNKVIYIGTIDSVESGYYANGEKEYLKFTTTQKGKKDDLIVQWICSGKCLGSCKPAIIKGNIVLIEGHIFAKKSADGRFFNTSVYADKVEVLVNNPQLIDDKPSDNQDEDVPF